MRGLVIVHEGDMRQVRSLFSRDGRLTSEIFVTEGCSFELCRFHTDAEGNPVISDESGRVIEAADIGQRCSVIVLVAADHAADDQGLRRILTAFLRGDDSPAWSNETVIVLNVAPTNNSGLRSLAPRRVFFTPSDLPNSAATQFPSDGWTRQVHSELDGLIRMIDENQTRNPNVGFGMLLVDRKCNCFLMERLRDPGKGRFGTIGGNFERGHDIVSELDTVLKRRFRRDGGPQVDLGPILSCTNMKNEFLHYIDLTFLAIVKGGSVSDVLDEELRPLGQDALQHLPNQDAHETRLMFTLPEVAVFHRQSLLFAPVANAFESLCRTIFAEQLRQGRRRRIYVPSLIDEGRALELQLPEDLDCIRHIAAEMPWSKSALPFFEGDIS